MERTLTQAEQEIENAAIAKFVSDAAKATPEQRKLVIQRMARFANPESEWGERPVIGGHKMSVAGVNEVIRQIRAL